MVTTELETIIREHDLTDEDLKEFEGLNSTGMDSETTGLKPYNCDLHLVQLATDKSIFVIKAPNKDSKNLIKVLMKEDLVKIFHYAIFDLGFLIQHILGPNGINYVPNIYCTKMAAKLLEPRGYYGLGPTVKKYLGVELDKNQIAEAKQSDGTYYWLNLTDKQLEYAANDVRYLRPLAVNQTHKMKEKKDLNGRSLVELAQGLFTGISGLATIQAYGVRDDIYRHR